MLLLRKVLSCKAAWARLSTSVSRLKVPGLTVFCTYTSNQPAHFAHPPRCLALHVDRSPSSHLLPRPRFVNPLRLWRFLRPQPHAPTRCFFSRFNVPDGLRPTRDPCAAQPRTSRQQPLPAAPCGPVPEGFQLRSPLFEIPFRRLDELFAVRIFYSSFSFGVFPRQPLFRPPPLPGRLSPWPPVEGSRPSERIATPLCPNR